MTKHVSFIFAFVVLVAVGALMGAPVPITNGNFETPALANDGDFTTGSITGWNHVSGAGTVFGVTRLTTASITPRSIDGNQVAFLREGTGVLGQTLAINLTANTTYTLNIWIGRRSDIAFAGYTFGLFAGGAALVTETDAVTPTAGTWVNRILTFTALAGNPNLGQPVEIRFGETVPSGLSQTVFDSFSLDASPVPEPSTMSILLLGGAAIGGARVLRRKK
jgi:hypothetical protein